MSLELDEAKLERGRSLEDSHETVVQVLNETVISGKVGALTLDPQYLKVEPLQSKYKLILIVPRPSPRLWAFFKYIKLGVFFFPYTYNTKLNLFTPVSMVNNKITVNNTMLNSCF